MIRSVDPSGERFLADLARTQARLDRAEREISSGLKVASASDAPDQISGILQLHAELERNAQIRTNLGTVKADVDTAEKTLQISVQLLERARTLAVQASGTTQTAGNRLNIAEEVRGLHDQLISNSRTIVGGRFIFSGDQDQLPAYDSNLTNANGVNRLIAATSTRQIQHPGGSYFSAGRTAEVIFDNRNADGSLAPDNAFAAVNGLRVALEANDQAGIESSLASLRQASDHLNAQLSFYGVTQNRIADAIGFANKLEIQLKTDLSGKEDADLTASILELNQARTQQEATFSARARLPQKSLFDYLG